MPPPALASATQPRLSNAPDKPFLESAVADPPSYVIAMGRPWRGFNAYPERRLFPSRSCRSFKKLRSGEDDDKLSAFGDALIGPVPELERHGGSSSVLTANFTDSPSSFLVNPDGTRYRPHTSSRTCRLAPCSLFFAAVRRLARPRAERSQSAPLLLKRRPAQRRRPITMGSTTWTSRRYGPCLQQMMRCRQSGRF